MQFVLKSINFYRDQFRWTLQYPSSATVCWSYCPQVMGALAHQSLYMVNVAGSYYPRELTGSDNLGMLFPLRSRNHFLIWLMFEEGPSVLPKLTLTTVFDVSVSTGIKNHCSVFLALQFLTLCQWRMKRGVIVWHCRESLDKIRGRRTTLKQEEQWNADQEAWAELGAGSDLRR